MVAPFWLFFEQARPRGRASSTTLGKIRTPLKASATNRIWSRHGRTYYILYQCLLRGNLHAIRILQFAPVIAPVYFFSCNRFHLLTCINFNAIWRQLMRTSLMRSGSFYVVVATNSLCSGRSAYLLLLSSLSLSSLYHYHYHHYYHHYHYYITLCRYAYAGRLDRLAEVVTATKAYSFSPGRGGICGNIDSGGEAGELRSSFCIAIHTCLMSDVSISRRLTCVI